MIRIILFILTNLAVMTVMFLAMHLFGLDNYMGSNSYYKLGIISIIVGFTGSFISLAMSKWVAKRTMGLYILDQNNPSNDYQSWLIRKVQEISQLSGIKTPEIAFFPGEPNAFATGMFKNSALVAFSNGLIENMTKEEVEAVISHEIGHISNGDMVTMTLIQGVTNTFVFFISRIFANILQRFLPQQISGLMYYISVIIFEIIFGILASIIVMWFSRNREYRADKFAAEKVGKTKMINALIRLSNNNIQPLPERMSAMGINGKGFLEIFSTHPSLQKRVDYLETL